MGGIGQVERTEGLKPSELAEQMEMQPITLTRLTTGSATMVGSNAAVTMPTARVNRLYLRKAARPLLGKLSGCAPRLTATALDGISPADAHRLLAQLELIKENVRSAIQGPAENLPGGSSAMADPVLKFPPDQKGNPPHTPVARFGGARGRLMTALRRHRRTLLLVVLPLAALLAGGNFLSQWRPLRDHR